jgi:hypothetical protein
MNVVRCETVEFLRTRVNLVEVINCKIDVVRKWLCSFAVNRRIDEGDYNGTTVDVMA